jgi:hypothetical protein
VWFTLDLHLAKVEADEELFSYWLFVGGKNITAKKELRRFV